MKKPEEVLGGKKSSKHTSKKKKHRETRIEHHSDGSHTVRHVPADGGDEVSYAAPDLAAVHQGLDQNIGTNTAEPSPEPAPEPTGSPQA